MAWAGNHPLKNQGKHDRVRAMHILSNDYRSNIPGESHIAHGGPANFARDFADFALLNGHTWTGLVQRGHDATATKIVRAKKIGGKVFDDCFLPQTRYLPFLQQTKTDPRVWFAEEIATLRTHIRKVSPDVLFLNGYSVYAWLLMEAAAQEGLPIVIQHAGIARVEFEQYKHLYSLAGRKAMLAMERDIVASATFQVFLNEYSKDAFSKIVARVPAKQALVIPLPYSRNLIDTKPLPQEKHEGITIGCVARWDRIKNHRALLGVAKEAKKRGLPWTVTAVTRIPDTKVDIRFKNDYRRTITLVPPMEQAALVDFYRSVDLCILPSHFDVSPTVVMEAALLGRPTLISAGVGWNTEYKKSGLGRWIVDFSDPAKVVRTIQARLKERPSPRFRKLLRATHAPNKVFAAYLRAFADAKRLCE